MSRSGIRQLHGRAGARQLRRLKPVANTGGPTMTQGLPRSSPAVNAGGLPASSSCPAADQRGESRPWGPACDIGAYELHYRL